MINCKKNNSCLYQSGFTLVEMMIAVSILGVLAAVSVSNFKKYQAKSKVSEAKIQLASAYTAETSFYQLYDMYATCLDYMGFDPSSDVQQRYFAIGFPNVTANIDAGFYNAAVGERLVSGECPRDLVDTPGKSVFLAGKSIGSAVMDNLVEVQTAATITSNSLDDNLGPVSSQVHAGIGVQLTEDNKVFTIMACGYIDSTAITPDRASLWSINHLKKLTNFQTGY